MLIEDQPVLAVVTAPPSGGCTHCTCVFPNIWMTVSNLRGVKTYGLLFTHSSAWILTRILTDCCVSPCCVTELGVRPERLDLSVHTGCPAHHQHLGNIIIRGQGDWRILFQGGCFCYRISCGVKFGKSLHRCPSLPLCVRESNDALRPRNEPLATTVCQATPAHTSSASALITQSLYSKPPACYQLRHEGEGVLRSEKC